MSAPSFSGEAAGLVAVNPTSDTSLLTLDRRVVRISRTGLRVREAAKQHEASLTDWPAAMFTMTHRPGCEPDKGAITLCVKNLRQWAKRKLGVASLRYVWVAELQEGRARAGDSGALHYHLVVWLPPELKRRGNALVARNPKMRASGVLPKLDKKGWWKLGSTERDWCRKSAVAYLAKYLSKGGEVYDGGADFPKGFRIHASGGFDKPQRFQRAYNHLPKWWREVMTPEHRGARAPGGGIVSRLTGEHLRSPWLVISTGRLVRLIKCSLTATTSERQALMRAGLESFFSTLRPTVSAAVC